MDENINISLDNLQDYTDFLSTQVIMKGTDTSYEPSNPFDPVNKQYVDDKVSVYTYNLQASSADNKKMLKDVAYRIGYDEPTILIYKNSPSIYNGIALIDNKIKSTHYFIDTNYDKEISNGQWDNAEVEGNSYGVEYLNWTIMKIEYDEAADTVNVNDNFKKIRIPKESNYLGLTNTTEFKPTGDYNPATKKYVDEAVLKKGNANFYYWDGLSSTDNSANLALWQEIMTRGQTEEIIVVVGGNMVFTNFIRIAPDTATVHSTGVRTILGTAYQPTSNKSLKTKGTDLLMQGIKVTLNVSSVDPVTISSVNAVGTNTISMGHFLPTETGLNYTFTPTEDGQPATKKYVDDAINELSARVAALEANNPDIPDEPSI